MKINKQSIVGIYAIKDRKAKMFASPFVMNSTQELDRQMKDAANSTTENYVNQYIHDKEIWKLGTMNPTTGEIFPNTEHYKDAEDYIDHKWQQKVATLVRQQASLQEQKINKQLQSLREDIAMFNKQKEAFEAEKKAFKKQQPKVITKVITKEAQKEESTKKH